MSEEDFSEYAEIIEEAEKEGFEFKLKKPLMPNGAGKRYYPGFFIDCLNMIGAILEMPRKPVIRYKRKGNWKPRLEGSKYMDADKLLEAVDIVEVVSGYTQLRRDGINQRGICPLHGSKDIRSFKVDTSRQLFYCFGCQKGGNAINFIMECESLTFKDAIAFLAERFNVKSQ